MRTNRTFPHGRGRVLLRPRARRPGDEPVRQLDERRADRIQDAIEAHKRTAFYQTFMVAPWCWRE